MFLTSPEGYIGHIGTPKLLEESKTPEMNVSDHADVVFKKSHGKILSETKNLMI